MKKVLQQYPFFLLLLPLFFVFHGYVENYYFMHFSDCLPLLGIYPAATLVLYFLIRFFLKNQSGAALLTAYFMSVYFFFGAAHQFLRKNSIFLHKYSLLLPFLALLTIGLIVYVKKKTSLLSVTIFLNSLLFMYILADTLSLATHILHHGTETTRNHPSMAVPLVSCDSCLKPDIYLLLFDGYSSSKALKEAFGYDNGSFDKFLSGAGFQIQKNSRSNYDATAFSMASTLNFSYLDDPGHLNANNATAMMDLIGKNRVVEYLYSQGYSVANYSPFDVQGHPSLQEIPFLPTRARAISNRTLFNYLMRDLYLWMWVEKHLEDSTAFSDNMLSMSIRTNRQFIAATKEETTKNSAYPRFVYTHLFMPHFPFYYDSLLRRRSNLDIVTHLGENNFSYYLEYLQYTNACAKDLISTIKKNSHGRAIIIFMSDHGIRYPFKGTDPMFEFSNQNAVYFPDGDYRSMHDSMSNVNVFRAIFNKLFRQKLPMLPDTSFILKNKEE